MATTEQRHDRHQRQVQTQESMPRSSITQQQHSWLPFSIIMFLLITLAYVIHPNFPLWIWFSPLMNWENGIERTAAARPRIELHPEDHIFRPAETRHLGLKVTSGQRRPDGVLKQVYIINDLLPGPTIEARSGDTLMIHVINDLQEDPITLHWHGVHTSNAMDGAAGVSQCPIAPGGQYTYNITIPSDQHGTFWYHAHTGLTRADGLYGGLVVHAPASTVVERDLMTRGHDDFRRYGYEKELLLLIGDWYHRSAPEVLAWYMDPGNVGNEAVPDSLLINGVGNFNCAMAPPARPVDCIEQSPNTPNLDLDLDTIYRIRVVNTGSMAGFTLSFGYEKVELIQIDGVDVNPQRQQEVGVLGVLSPGQRMDFILHPSKNAIKGSSMMVKLDDEEFRFPNLALTPEQAFIITYHHTSPQPTSEPTSEPVPSIHNEINLAQVASSPSVLQGLPEKADKTFVVYTKIQKMSRNRYVPFGYLNHTTWKIQRDPTVPVAGLPRNQWDKHQFGITTGPGPVWVDLVVNNLDEGSHPFHLHGHHFYVLRVYKSTIGIGSYDRSYDPFTDPFPPGLEIEKSPETIDSAQPYDLTNASLRDTLLIPRRGYAVLRFRADNPGIWLFHCHMTWHLATGMAMLIDVQGDPAGEVAHDTSLRSRLVGGVCPE